MPSPSSVTPSALNRACVCLKNNITWECVPTSLLLGIGPSCTGTCTSVVRGHIGTCWSMAGSHPALVSGFPFVKIRARAGRDWCVPGLGSPGGQALRGSSVPCGGGLWALTQAAGQEGGPLMIPTSYWWEGGSSLASSIRFSNSLATKPSSRDCGINHCAESGGFLPARLAREALYPPTPLSPGLLRMILADNGVGLNLGRGHIPVRFVSQLLRLVQISLSSS